MKTPQTPVKTRWNPATGWPFARVKPLTAKQQRDKLMRETEPAPF